MLYDPVFETPVVRLGIVGSEAAKFTKTTESRARALINGLLMAAVTVDPEAAVVSGGCHLGGIDLWAEEEARNLGWPDYRIIRHAPASKSWPHYKARNIKIAEDSTRVICITVKKLPPGVRAVGRDGRLLPGPGGWESFCYHCGTSDHVKSGGCWTVRHARKLGKPGDVLVVD
jgi:hypothetical protein